MTRVDCERAEELIAAGPGELDDGERAALEQHLGGCESCRQASRLLGGFVAALEDLEPEPLPKMVERRITVGAAAGVLGERQRRRRRIGIGALAACLALGAAAVLWALLPGGDEAGPAVAEAPDAPEDQGPVTAPSDDGEDRRGPGVTVKTVADGRQLIEVDSGTRLWIEEQAEVRVERMDPLHTRFGLDRGRVVAEVGPHPEGYRFVVSTPAGEVEAKGTVFAVDVQPDRGARTRVIEGVVKVTRSAAGRRAADSFLVRAGEAGQVDGDAVAAEPAAREAVEQDLCLIHGCPAPEPGPLPGDGEDEAAEAELASAVEPSPPASSVSAGGRPRVETRPQPSATSAGPAPADPSPKEPEADEEWAVQTLVTLALDQRKSGRYPVAAETYRALIERHPGSAAAASALVSLGQLELVELGRPGQALGRFDAYLARAPNGLLAEEARLGRVRARARMGGPAALIAAADDYLKAHLGGYAGAEVTRRRADARRQLGDCAGAIADYRQVQSLWPTSPENARAAKGLEACGEQP